jgi:Copper amine oxidase N-terminal domain.
MKLKLISAILLFTLLFSTILPLYGSAEDAERTATDEIKVMLDGTQLTFDVLPQIIDGRTMVPMRKIFEAFGATVAWDNDTKTITATKGTTAITMQIGNTSIGVGETVVVLDVPPQIVDSRTLVPVRAVAESFHAAVRWEGETKTVFLTSAETADSDSAGMLFQLYPTQTPSFLFSTQKDWYFKIDPSFELLKSENNSSVFQNSDGSEMMMITVQEQDEVTSDFGAFMKKAVKDLPSYDQKIKEDLQVVTINGLEYYTFATSSVLGEPIVNYYYFTVWDQKIFGVYFVTYHNALSQSFLDSLHSFQPNADKGETEAYINRVLTAQ